MAWAIPQELLDAVPDSPYEWPPELWKRRRALAEEQGEGDTPTLAIVRRMLPAGGTLLDVGAGTGRLSLPLAAAGYRVTAVERDAGMAQGFREEAGAAGLDARVVEETWPEAAEGLPAHDVVLCAHVVYDVQVVGPFLRALHDRAERGVALELTPEHPWANLAPFYRALHDLDRPSGPTVDDLLAVVEEEIGLTPAVERWRRGGQLWFVDMAELVGFYRRRLVLPVEREAELATLLEPEVVERDGRLFLGARDRELVTVWWER